MECQASESKKLFKVFEAKRKRARKKRDGNNDSNSIATDDSESGCIGNCEHGGVSAKGSMQDVSITRLDDVSADAKSRARDRSISITRSPTTERSPRSPRRHHRRYQRQGNNSLALKAGLVSTPRSDSIPQDVEDAIDSISKDQDSSIYAYLEDAIKRDKKKHRHGSRRHERERDPSEAGARHRHRRRCGDDARSNDRENYVDKPKEQQPNAVPPAIDQNTILETFAKLCATLNEKTAQINQLTRNQSHKSLQCEDMTKPNNYQNDIDHHPIRLRSTENSRENIPLSRTRTRSNIIHDGRVRSQENMLSTLPLDSRKPEKCGCYHALEHDASKYESKVTVRAPPSRPPHEGDNRYREYPLDPSKSLYHTSYRSTQPEPREYRNYDSHKETVPNRPYEEEKRRYLEQKTSRSCDIDRVDRSYDERQRTSRTDYKRYQRDGERDRRSKDKYYAEKIDARERHFINDSKDRRYRRNLDGYERNSTASRDDDYRDRYSERERDSGSVADGDTSTVSGKSNYMRVVKQEIAEQREAMDKMMKLWKELMRCFKGVDQTQKPDKVAYEKAESAHESAAAQLRLWRECMRRYETVARDVGDTDARLMEEINKQRSEMAEMSTMWQECLQRYRDMSHDFNSLKQQLATSESPTRDVCAPPAPLPAPPHTQLDAPPYAHAPPHTPLDAPPYAHAPPPGLDTPYGPPASVGSTLRARASAPPAWWWCQERPPQPRSPPRSPRRRSSPDSRASPERRRRHYRHERDESRSPKYKEKPKASVARSEHRHKKR